MQPGLTRAIVAAAFIAAAVAGTGAQQQGAPQGAGAGAGQGGDLEPRPMRGVQPFPHWWIWSIPATATSPQVHHYVFDLFALDTNLDALAAGASRDDLNKAMDGHVVGHAVMVIPFHQ